jgi:hypothetical protein
MSMSSPPSANAPYRVPSITVSSVIEALQQFNPAVVPSPPGHETVVRMIHRRKPYLSVVVYTTVVEGEARRIGEDAIRVFVRHENSGRLLIGFPKIYRGPAWSRILADRVRNVFQLIRMDELPRCVNCETLMILMAPRGREGALLWVCPQRDGPFQPCRLVDARPGVLHVRS